MRTTKFALALATAFASLSMSARFANAQSAPTTPAVNDKALVNFLGDFVYQLEKPIYVYNWFNAQSRDPVWTRQLSSSDRAGYDHYKSMSLNYWGSFCSSDASLNPKDCAPDAHTKAMQFGQGNMFGPGLYAAIDPVATSSYGGMQDSWVLMQMHLPKGMRLMDLRRDGQTALPIRVQKVLDAYGCPNSWDDVQNGLNNILSANNTYLTGQMTYNQSGNNSGIKLSDQCLLEIRKVLKDDLKLDALFYSYNSAEFAECDLPAVQGQNTSSGGNNPFRQGAFVITSGNILQPADVRVFTPRTTDDMATRIRIQSLFYKADVDSPSSTYQAYFQSLTYPNYPGYTYGGSTQNCSYNNNVQTCKMQIYIYNPTTGGNMVTIDPPSMPPTPVMPAKISASQVPGSQQLSASSTYVNNAWVQGKKSILWADLDGQPVASDLGKFVQDNFFGCQATREYDAADDQ